MISVSLLACDTLRRAHTLRKKRGRREEEERKKRGRREEEERKKRGHIVIQLTQLSKHKHHMPRS